MEFILCKSCMISKSWSYGKSYSKHKYITDLKKVDNSTKNDILKQIMKHNLNNINSTYTIISSNNRYRITVVYNHRKYYLLIQDYMHYDIKNGYIPVYSRFVKIIK